MQELRENIKTLFLSEGDYKNAYIADFMKNGKALMLFLVYKGIITQQEFDDFIKIAVDISITTEIDNMSDEKIQELTNTIADGVKFQSSMDALNSAMHPTNSSDSEQKTTV